MNKTVLEIRQVEKSFVVGGNRVQVLKGIDLTVSAGEVIAIMGPSGAGKTTLLSIAGGIMRPTAGTVRIAGQELYTQNDEALAGLRNRSVGFVFQMHYLLPEFTAEENVMLPALITGGDRAPARQRARQLLEQVGLAGRTRHRPGELSGGEQQRVAIARALQNQPALLLADEPTGDLDRATAREIQALFIDLNRRQGQTVIMVTHNPELGDLADRIVMLEDGLVVLPPEPLAAKEAETKGAGEDVLPDMPSRGSNGLPDREHGG